MRSLVSNTDNTLVSHPSDWYKVQVPLILLLKLIRNLCSEAFVHSKIKTPMNSDGPAVVFDEAQL